MKKKTIGILGGMGPEASSRFYQEILSLTRIKYKAVQDTDYPAMVLYSLPLEGFNEKGICNKELVTEGLIHGVKLLEQADCDFIVIPCNTVHLLFDEMKNAVSIPILNIVDETVKKLKKGGKEKAGLLASESSLKSDLYGKYFRRNDILYFEPDKKETEMLTHLIEQVMGNSVSSNTKTSVLKILKRFEDKKVDSIVLGCTELPLVINETDSSVEIFNTLTILAEAALNKALG